MKRFYALLLCCCVWAMTYAAPADSLKKNRLEKRISLSKTPGQFSLAPMLGTDIGGAVPVPFKAMQGTMNPYPKLNASLGVRLNVNFRKHWNIAGEITYKTITMDADARVTNQKFKGENTVQFFTGISDVHMSYTILELPLYVTYMFGKTRQHGLALGGYYAYNFTSSFVTVATKGFIGDRADKVDAPVEEPMEMNFSSQLDDWDAGLLLGYHVRIYPRVNMGLRFMAGFKDIFKKGSDFFDYRMLHMRGCIVLSYDILHFGPKKHFK